MNFLDLFRAARRVSTPLIAVRTADPGATQQAIVDALIGDMKAKEKPAPPFLAFDVVRGCYWLNDAGMLVAWQTFLEKNANVDPPDTPDRIEQGRQELKRMTSGALVEVLDKAEKLPGGAILFLHNAQRYIDKAEVIQAVWNLRDLFKQDRRTLVLLGSLSLTLPAELSQDVLVLEDPLPTLEQLQTIVVQQFGNAGADQPDRKIVQQAVDAVCGLAAFPAEQITAMSFVADNGKITLDTGALWDRKRQMIENTPGLSVWRGGETFADIGGVSNAKEFLKRIMQGNERPRVIVFQDEIEKQFAGASSDAGDSSGTTQEMHGALLSEMENRRYTGVILIGPPGASKSMLAKATGATFGVPTIAMDLSSMKSKFVGSSNENLRTALAVIYAVSQGRAFFVATSNKIAALPPELRRRYSFGTYFFDLPTAEERAVIWPLYFQQFGLKEQQLPADEGWTGAEIRNCALLAYRMQCSLKEAAKFITPVARTAAADIEKLRQQASGCYLSASYEGFYQANRAVAPLPTVPGKRAIAVEG